MTKPKPCPFCGLELEWEDHPCRALPGDVHLRLWKHPKANCYASTFEVTPEDVLLWNRRTK